MKEVMPRDQEGLASLIESEGVSPRVVAAFRQIDRADFVPRAARREAYGDRPVGIAEHQTTSQPSLIARMIDAAEVEPNDRVLEVGTGLGYQTALLAQVAAEVVSIDRHASLVGDARANLAGAGIENVEVVVGDGWKGWPDKAPYAAIIVSAGAAELPAPFEGQLVEGGRLVIPLTGGMGDDVYVYKKVNDKLVRQRLLTPARFVPLVRDRNDKS